MLVKSEKLNKKLSQPKCPTEAAAEEDKEERTLRKVEQLTMIFKQKATLPNKILKFNFFLVFFKNSLGLFSAARAETHLEPLAAEKRCLLDFD